MSDKSARTALVALVVLVALAEGVVAWTTHGTFDVTNWQTFADSVARVGPIRIYSLDVYGPNAAGLMVYNHPPLVGWWLAVVNAATSVGIPFPFMIRLPSILAHAATTLLVLDLVRRRRGDRAGYLAALVVALSPILLIIAGYHGNNDPVVAALMLAAVWLLVDRRAPLWAGFAFSLAVSVKITPLVILPVLLVAALALDGQRGWRPRALLHRLRGARDLWRFVLGGLPVLVLVWGGPLALATKGYINHVLRYSGSGFPRQWGIYELLFAANAPLDLLRLYRGPGTYGVLLLCALVPAWFIRRRPADAPAAVALALTGFVLISPAWATQYLAWIAGPVLLLSFWPAVLFTVGAGGVYLALYAWLRGDVRPLTTAQVVLVFFAWLSLIPVVVVGVRDFVRQERRDRAAPIGSRGEDPAVGH